MTGPRRCDAVGKSGVHKPRVAGLRAQGRGSRSERPQEFAYGHSATQGVISSPCPALDAHYDRDDCGTLAVSSEHPHLRALEVL